MKALLTRKVGMTSTISEDGSVQAVTLLSMSPNIVTQLKTEDTDGYNAIQLGFEKANDAPKPQKGHFKKAGMYPAIVREFRISQIDPELKIGTKVSADSFSVGDVVHVRAISKGKGFAGTIKRHGFHRQRKTHGGKGNTRQPGSIGSMYPQKIFKGKKMAGQKGGGQVTVKNLRIALIDDELGVIGVSGAVPGPRKCIVEIQGASK